MVWALYLETELSETFAFIDHFFRSIFTLDEVKDAI
jgi:hypothetical protein